MREIVAHIESREDADYPKAAILRTRLHLASLTSISKLVIIEQLITAHTEIYKESDITGGSYEGLLKAGIQDQLAFADALQPVFDGRFTGRKLMETLTVKSLKQT